MKKIIKTSDLYINAYYEMQRKFCNKTLNYAWLRLSFTRKMPPLNVSVLFGDKHND